MPCCVCVEHGLEQTTRTEAHHEPPRSAGGIDTDTLPLCDAHHDERHDRVGRRQFWERYRIDPVVVIAYMRRLTNERLSRGEIAA